MKKAIVFLAVPVLAILFLCVFGLLGITIPRTVQRFLGILMSLLAAIMVLFSLLQSGRLTQRGFWIGILGIVVIIVVTIVVA